MIPVALPSVEFLTIVSLLFLTAIIWLVWTLWLLFFRNKNKPWATRWFALYGVITFPALFTIYQVVSFTLELRALNSETERNYGPTLTQDERLGQIDMPAGTKLRLSVAATPQAFRRAIFPHPVALAGINALEVDRYISIQYDKAYNITGFTPENMRIVGEGTTVQQGWTCKATWPVEFDVNADGSIAGFKRCMLAEGNEADAIALPRNTQVWATTGNVYVNGFVDTDRWNIDIPHGVEVLVDGLRLLNPRISLNEARKLHEVSSAVMTKDTTFGTITHAAGTMASFNPLHIRKTYPDAWLMTPKADIGEDNISPAPHGIVQDRTGKVLATLPR